MRGLATVISCLDVLSSGENEVQFGVAVDDDDPATRIFALGLAGSLPIAVLSGPRPQSLGGLVNNLAERMPADVYCSLTDDLLVLTPNWDREIAKAVTERPGGVFWWQNALPQKSLFAVVSEGWRKAAGGIFTDHYPFWFDDWVLIELWMMATGESPLELPIFIADKPRHTHRLRDLAFWQRFYSHTRLQRVRWAEDIARNLGLPHPAFAKEIGKRLNETLLPMTDEMASKIEWQGDKGEPDPAYLRAKSRAEVMMKEAA